MHIVAIVLAALGAFAAANIGDLFVLLLLFADREFKSWQVFMGQYLGVGMVIVLCLFGAAVVSRMPHTFIEALGLVPIAIGVYKLKSRSAVSAGAVGPAHRATALRNVAVVAGISLADCSDNIAVFTPLLAPRPLNERVIIVSVFLLLIGVWCLLARLLTRHPRFGERVRNLGEHVGPWVLIALGLFVIADSAH